jgi:hypothetical protein
MRGRKIGVAVVFLLPIFLPDQTGVALIGSRSHSGVVFVDVDAKRLSRRQLAA